MEFNSFFDSIQSGLKKDINSRRLNMKISVKEFNELSKKYFKNLNDKDTDSFTGLYSRSIGSSFWETKLISLDFNDNSNRFDSETIDFDEFMESDDEIIQYEIIDQLKKYIYYGYDQETDREFEYPETKSVDLSIFKEFESDPGNYCSVNWTDEYLEITNSDIWGLSLSFPHIIDLYL